MKVDRVAPGHLGGDSGGHLVPPEKQILDFNKVNISQSLHHYLKASDVPFDFGKGVLISAHEKLYSKM